MQVSTIFVSFFLLIVMWFQYQYYPAGLFEILFHKQYSYLDILYCATLILCLCSIVIHFIGQDKYQKEFSTLNPIPRKGNPYNQTVYVRFTSMYGYISFRLEILFLGAFAVFVLFDLSKSTATSLYFISTGILIIVLTLRLIQTIKFWDKLVAYKLIDEPRDVELKE